MNKAVEPSAIDAVILCGGLGTRLQGVLKGQPKSMADFNDRPFLDLLIDYLGKFGFQRFVLCAGHMADPIQDYFEKKDDGRIYTVSREPSPLGTAGAIKYAESLIGNDVFLAMNGDSFCEVDLNSFLVFHYSKNAQVSIALAPMDDTSDFGGVTLGDNDEIISFNEKTDTPHSEWVNAGIYIFNRNTLDRIPAGKRVSLEQEIFPAMTGNRLFGFSTQSQLLDIGTPERLERARKFLIDLK